MSCNNFVKLGTLAQYADRLGAQYIATGHYARLEHREDGPHLFRTANAKDQSYALAQLTPRTALEAAASARASSTSPRRARTPSGWAYPVHEKTESQDICFVEGGDYRDVLARLRPEINRDGEIRTIAGELVGCASGHRQLHGRPTRNAPRA